jgi:uncharacterized protein (DUF1330 family)
MPKAYWITIYHSISDADKLAAYAALAGPAIEACGGQYLARGVANIAYESGGIDRTVICAFASVEAAIKAHDSQGYKKALDALGNAAIRDVRIIEGLE